MKTNFMKKTFCSLFLLMVCVSSFAQVINSSFATDKGSRSRSQKRIDSSIVRQKEADAAAALRAAELAKGTANVKANEVRQKRLRVLQLNDAIHSVNDSIALFEHRYNDWNNMANADSSMAAQPLSFTKGAKKRNKVRDEYTIAKAKANSEKMNALMVYRELVNDRDTLQNVVLQKQLSEISLDLAMRDSTDAVISATALDTIAQAKQLDAKNASDSNTDTTDNTWSGYILASGNVTNLENNLSNPNANISIGGALVHKRSTFLFSFNPKSAATSDSASMVKTFLFPEISARAFVLEYELALNGPKTTNGSKENADPVIFSNFFVNFSVGYIKDTSNSVITPYDLMSGFRFSIHKDLSKNKDSSVQKLDHLTLSLIPYYSMISIDPKEFTSYSAMFQEKPNRNTPPTVDALGGKFDFELGNFHVFIDYKYILNSHFNSVLNNSYWTIGSAVSTRLFKF
jgi:hypothetical protein